MVTKTIPKGGLKRSPISAVTLLQESPRGSNLPPIIAGSQPRSSYRESKIERERERVEKRLKREYIKVLNPNKIRHARISKRIVNRVRSNKEANESK